MNAEFGPSVDFVDVHPLQPVVEKAHQFDLKLHKKPPPLYGDLVYLRGRIITFEGGIGCGKTTLINSLAHLTTKQQVPTSCLYEEVDMGLLTLYLEFMDAHPNCRNPYAVPFQMDMLRRRQATYQQALDIVANRAHLVLIDRSLVGDYVFALMLRRAGHFTDVEWVEYMNLLRQTECLLAPALTIYLQCSADRALERTRRRNRTSEDKYTQAYFEELHRTYEEVLNLIDYPHISLDWNENATMSRIDDSLLNVDAVLAVIYTIRSIIIRPAGTQSLVW